jgi:cold shock CspA family protein
MIRKLVLRTENQRKSPIYQHLSKLSENGFKSSRPDQSNANSVSQGMGRLVRLLL